MSSKALRAAAPHSHPLNHHSYERVRAAADEAGDDPDVVAASGHHDVIRRASHHQLGLLGSLSVASAASASPPDRSSSDNEDASTISIAFFMMGLLNNASYVIMLASAKSISEGGTALVFLSCVIPSLTLKASAPYWFDKVDYKTRLAFASYLMAFAFLWVALFSGGKATTSPVSTPSSDADALSTDSAASAASAVSLRTIGQLVGVALISIQCGLGEASLLALAGKCDRSSHFSSSLTLTSTTSNHRSDDGRDDAQGLAAPASVPPPPQTALQTTKKGRCLTYFSSGTGLSGPFGFLWKMLWTGYVGLSLRSTCCLAAIVLASLYSYMYRSRLEGLRFGDDVVEGKLKPEPPPSTWDGHEDTAVVASPYQDRLDDSIRSRSSSPSTRQRYLAAHSALAALPSPPIRNADHADDDVNDPRLLHDPDRSGIPPPPSAVSVDWATAASHETAVLAIRDMDRSQRFRRILELWPYMVPLFTVYAAEYACQAGAWTAIGFPLQNANSRNQFYLASNWLYQLGVFCSRSSGTLFEVSVPVLWLMPALQVLNLVFFSWAAMHGDGSVPHWWYDDTVFRILAFYAGLLGGAVYVHGYVRIVKDVDPLHTEFALAATSVAESIGILVADVCGLVLQSCIYHAHGIDGALLTCPF